MEPFLGEIRMFSGNYAPQDWNFCNGQVLQINTNQALFTLLGNRYGGDGKTTFALPNLQGQVPMHWGKAPSGTTYNVAQNGGVENVTLTADQMPAHTHAISASYTPAGDQPSPQGNFIAGATEPSAGGNINLFSQSANTIMNPGSIGTAGGSLGHSNMQPYTCLTFIICMSGIFPPQQN